MNKCDLRAITDPFTKTFIAKKVGSLCLRIGEYIRRINKEEQWKKLQEDLSPVNWGLNPVCRGTIFESVSGKVKVRIFHQQASMWNAISSVYEQFAKDEKYDILIILTGSAYNLCAQTEQMIHLDAKYINARDYSFEEDKPDILLIYNSWVWNSFPKNLWSARKNTKLIVEIPLWTRDNSGSIERAHYDLHWDEIKPDACIVDQYMYNAYTAFDKKHRYQLLGHPKSDFIYRRLHIICEVPKSWDKLKGKKTLVFVTDHGLTMDGVYQDCAFDIYAKDIFNFFIEHDEYAMIFRPHDSYINDLLHSFWSFADYQYLRRMIDSSTNIIWDDTDDFTVAYSMADAVISDLNCDLTASAILLDKPVAVLHRNDMATRAYSPEITNHYVNIHSQQELKDFFCEFAMGNDSLRAERNGNIQNVVCSFDGKNGERIKTFIEKEYLKKKLQSRK